MPTKVGAGGKPQNYGKGGKYAATLGSTPLPNGANPEKRAKKIIKRFERDAVPDYDVFTAANRVREAVGKDPEVRIRVNHEVLERILTDGRVKTQHETGSSGGSFAPHTRDAHEKMMFAAELTRPVYGYVHAEEHAGNVYNGVGFYGRYAVVLKKGVNERTTITFGDSLYVGDDNAPAPVRLSEVATASDARLAASMTESRPGGYGGGSASYVEAQIHGGVTRSDIDRIIVSESSREDVRYIQAEYPYVKFEFTDKSDYNEFSVLNLEVLTPFSLF